MISIQKKILMLTTFVLFIMASIWIALTYYNYKTQHHYNEILQRYLNMNEVTRVSQEMITHLNNYMLLPSDENLKLLDFSKEKIQQAKYEVFPLRNEENQFALTNYINLVDSLVETTDRLILFNNGNDPESVTQEFSEANRISNYIAEMKLTLLDTELSTYDRFYRSIIEQSEELIKLGVWLILLITIALLIITYWLSLSITRPIQKLTEAANELSHGRFDMKIHVDANDEISFLAKTFDRMRININNLILEMKQKAQLEHELQQNKLLLQESQFRSLQSQINPHFLFNTLNTLSKKAYLEGSEETSDLLVSVAGLLRYNLKQIDRSVTLLEEVEVLKQYMDIQKARFSDRLIFHTEINEACLHVRIPALTLQPIIENAVIHAVEPSEEGGTILLKIEDGANWVNVHIVDDGMGMSQSKMEQILNEQQIQSESHSTGIGFSNVVKRLRLFYGYHDVISIKSIEKNGTTVTIKINKGVIEHDEAPNRR
ncbi:sensor histidine kinase [Robertmurraya massiliosenegalensis]|uniref:sensor histidine kinase n=1 Tax=Robertmurraya massiliosenegalensis TaxID=1287657 RepID=UPI0004746657|nr:histidine kinase [Robertmurraya massiliosenegalensis]